MKVSKEIIELVEKIKIYRTDVKLVNELKIENELLEKQVEEFEKIIINLKLKMIDQNKYLEQIKCLKSDNSKLKSDLEHSKKAYNFIMTHPNKASDTIYGEINTGISNAKSEILISSPWITYIVDELSNFKNVNGKKKITFKIITRLLKEDIEKGITMLDKFRILKEYGAEIRYNNNLHAKIVVLDKSVAIISSANLTNTGLKVNYEAGICLRDKYMANDVANFFYDAWNESEPLTQEAIDNVS